MVVQSKVHRRGRPLREQTLAGYVHRRRMTEQTPPAQSMALCRGCIYPLFPGYLCSTPSCPSLQRGAEGGAGAYGVPVRAAVVDQKVAVMPRRKSAHSLAVSSMLPPCRYPAPL